MKKNSKPIEFYIKKSKITILGYTLRHEIKKDQFLSQFKFLNISIPNLNEKSIVSLVRQHKIDEITDTTEKFDSLLLDLSDQYWNISSTNKIRSFISYLKNINENTIIVVSVNNPITGEFSEAVSNLTIFTDNGLVHQADLVFIIDQEIKILKNRMGYIGIIKNT